MLIATIPIYIAVGAIGSSWQELFQIVGVSALVVVYNGEFAGGDRGDVGFGDGESLFGWPKFVVAITRAYYDHSSSTCIGVVLIRNGVLCVRNDGVTVFNRNTGSLCLAIVGDRANLNSRILYSFRKDFPLYRFCAGVVAATVDGQLVATCIGPLRDLHVVVIIFPQRFIAELDRDLRSLFIAVIGWVLNRYLRALKV